MEQLSMFLVILAALLIPILMARFRVTTVPTAVAEIVTGIVLGASGFNVIRQTSQLTFLSGLGVILLMFLSGMEINFDLFKRQDSNKKEKVNPLKIAISAFVGIAIAAAILAFIIYYLGLFSDITLATIIFSTIALGVVIATLKEKEILSKPIGQTILLTAVLGEVIPLLGLTIYASINGGNAGQLWLIILLFVAAIILLRRFKRPYLWFAKITKATTQIDIRLAFFLIFALVMIAESVGAENILGAFLAGMVMKLLEPSDSTKDKLTSIGYGFFIPIFFIMTGVKLNLRTLFGNHQALMLLPVLVLGLILAKIPALLVYIRHFKKRNALAGSFLTATTITIVLPAVQVARNLHTISETQSSAFILAAVIVCVISPIIFNSNFVLTPEDKIKKNIVVVGANLFTIIVAQELHDDWYNVKVLTMDPVRYNTYKSRMNVELVSDISEASLEKAGAFDSDLFVAAFSDDKQNIVLSKLAVKHQVKRVIARMMQPSAEQITRLQELKVEIYNSFRVRAASMRALIESPGLYKIITDSNTILYDVVVRNRRYTGRQLMDLPFINQITISRIRRGDTWLNPHGHTVIEPGDEIIYTGKITDADKVREMLSLQN